MKPAAIIDAHVHWWHPPRLRYPWLASVPALHRSFLPADFSAAIGSAPMAKAVFIECGCDPAQNLEEVAWVSALARQESRLGGLVAQINLEKGEAALPELRQLAANPLVKGVRYSLQDQSDPGFCLRPGFLGGVRLLSQFGFSFDLCIRHHQLALAAEMVGRCPEVAFVLDHLGKPNIRERQYEAWAKDLKNLAALPNVCCKLSGLTTEADLAQWQLADLRPFARHALECFGPDRLLYGGDWPVCTLATSYTRWLETVQTLIADLGETDRHKIFFGNAQSFYRLS